ncbi:MAG: hypothetical protein EAZ08_12285 [Cytophagales bacterium]|nr:MAG: hypothetical protein EAZ08_12285 [Cytophagales bacterium]
MKKIVAKSFTIIFLSFALLGCEKILVGTEPALPELVFETFWQDMDKNFSFFSYRNIDWDSVYRAYRPKVNAQTTDDELAKIFDAMISKFKVGHLDIADIRNRTVANGLPNVDSRTYLGNARAYTLSYIENLQNTKVNVFNAGESILFYYGGVKNTDFGYIFISTMFGQSSDFEKIDEILNGLKNKKGIIIDVRNNGGGNSNNGALVAGRFFKETQFVGYIKYRLAGGKRSDFTDWQRMEYPKVGKENYQGNIVLLTSRSSGSATETFVKVMRGLPNVTTVGDTTWGSIGNNPVYKTLPNRWNYRFPTAVEVDKDKKSNEGIGFAPDIFILNTLQAQAEGRDLMLEKAIEVLKNK